MLTCRRVHAVDSACIEVGGQCKVHETSLASVTKYYYGDEPNDG
jgi:hypothetical protein